MFGRKEINKIPYKDKEKRKINYKKYYQDHKEIRSKYSKQYYIKHKEYLIKCVKERDTKLRINVLNIISEGNPYCIRCGCDDVRLLEINHKYGGGNKELTKERQEGRKTLSFYRDIIKGKRKTDDLELLCRVCNSWHYLELKYGKLPYKVIYDGKKEGEE